MKSLTHSRNDLDDLQIIPSDLVKKERPFIFTKLAFVKKEEMRGNRKVLFSNLINLHIVNAKFV